MTVKNFFLKSFELIRHALKIEDLIFISGQSAIISNRIRYDQMELLDDAEVKVYSQFGEDGILDYLCEKLKIRIPIFFEIGVGDFSECNCRLLCELRNAEGFIVDSNMSLYNNLKKKDIFWKTTIEVYEKLIDKNNIVPIVNNFFKKYKNPDIFSLDIDGIDYFILQKIPLKKFKIVILEYNAIFGSTKSVTIPYDEKFSREKYHFSHLCFGVSLKAYIEFMNENGFTLIGCTKARNNAFFIKNDLLHNINIKIPKEKDLEYFTVSRIRESRNSNRKLNFKEGKEKLNEIKHCKLIDLSDGLTKSISEIFKI
mgnify:CR=1 FL=1